MPTHFLLPVEQFLVVPTHFEDASDAPEWSAPSTSLGVLDCLVFFFIKESHYPRRSPCIISQTYPLNPKKVKNFSREKNGQAHDILNVNRETSSLFIHLNVVFDPLFDFWIKV